MISIGCSFPAIDLESFTPEEKQRFGKLVHELRKQGKDLKSAQVIAFHQVLSESLPDVK